MKRDDRGVAALELALVMSLMTALLALVLPLGVLFLERLRLGSAVADGVRFASSRSNVDRQVPLQPAVRAGDLPTPADVDAEVRRAYDGIGTLTVAPPTTTTDDGCPSRRRTTLVITSRNLPLGPFAGLLDESLIELTASATSCQE